MSDLPKHLTQGGPGDEYLGNGKINTKHWFKLPPLDQQIKDQDIWFCSAPFQMVYTNVNGDMYPCSWATESPGNVPNVKDTSLRYYYKHDSTLNEMRKEMTTPGSDLKTCKSVCASCIYQEENYGRSRRQASLKIQTNDIDLWPRLRKNVEDWKKTSPARGLIDGRIFEIQVKAFGNQCNLDCYMCMPYDSTQRIKSLDHNELSLQEVFDESSIFEGLKTKSRDINILISQVKEFAPYIYNLKLIGGEPLVMKKYYDLLDAIIDTGEAHNIKIKYQTNMSVLTYGKYNFLDYVDKFDLFEITVSLDSIGVANDYIRRRSDWEQIKSNIIKLQEYDNVQINVNGAISFLSVLRFHELIKWFNDNSNLFTQINWSNIRNPEKLRANMLPDKIKEDLIPKYEGFPDIQNLLREGNNGIHHKKAIDYFLMNDARYKGTKWEMHLFDVFPELKEYYTA